MPRNGATYKLPIAAVAAGELIQADWANEVLNDIKDALTASLSRDGAGSMSGPLRHADGSVSAPGIAFSSDTDTGLYRPGSGELAIAVDGVKVASLGTDFSLLKDTNGTLAQVAFEQIPVTYTEDNTVHTLQASDHGRMFVCNLGAGENFAVELPLNATLALPVGFYFEVFMVTARGVLLSVEDAAQTLTVYSTQSATTSTSNPAETAAYSGPCHLRIIKIATDEWIAVPSFYDGGVVTF